MRKTAGLLLVCISLAAASCSKDDSEKRETATSGNDNNQDAQLTSAKRVLPAGATRVNIELHEKPLEKLLEAVRQQTNRVVCLAEDSVPHGSDPVTVSFRNTSFWEAVARISKKTGLGIEMQVDKILLTESIPPHTAYCLVGHGLLVLDVPITLTDSKSGVESQGLAIMLYTDPEEMAFVRLSEASIILENRKTIALALEQTRASSPWVLECIGPLPKEAKDSTALAIEGKIQADFKYNLIQVSVAPKLGAKAILDGLSIEVTACKKENNTATARVVVRQNTKLAQKKRGVLSVIRIVPLDRRGDRILPFGHRGGGTPEESVFNVLMAASVLDGGQIVVTLAESKTQEFTFRVGGK